MTRQVPHLAKLSKQRVSLFLSAFGAVSLLICLLLIKDLNPRHLTVGGSHRKVQSKFTPSPHSTSGMFHDFCNITHTTLFVLTAGMVGISLHHILIGNRRVLMPVKTCTALRCILIIDDTSGLFWYESIFIFYSVLKFSVSGHFILNVMLLIGRLEPETPRSKKMQIRARGALGHSG